MPPKKGKKGQGTLKGKAAGNASEVKDGKKGKGKGVARDEPPPEATRDYQCFILDMNKLDGSYDKLAKSIKEDLEKILTEESPPDKDGKKQLHLINGKLYTPKSGCFLVQLRPGMDSDRSSWVTLTYRWKYLYFESFHSKDKWFRFKDSEEPLPPRSQLSYGKKKLWRNHVHTFNFTTSHHDMGGFYIQIGPLSANKYYRSLRDADYLIGKGEIETLKKGALSFCAVGISEAMRDSVFRKWVSDSMAVKNHIPGVEPYVPEEHGVYFNEWGTNSMSILLNDESLEKEIADRLFIIKMPTDTEARSSVNSKQKVDGCGSKREGRGSGHGFGREHKHEDDQGDGHGPSHGDAQGDDRGLGCGNGGGPNNSGQAFNQLTPFCGGCQVIEKCTILISAINESHVYSTVAQTKWTRCNEEGNTGSSNGDLSIISDMIRYKQLMALEQLKRQVLELKHLKKGSQIDLPKGKQDKSLTSEQDDNRSEKKNDKESCAANQTKNNWLKTLARADTAAVAVGTAATSVSVASRVCPGLV